MSGGHVEVHKDLCMHECALRELQEEFVIEPKNIIKSIPVAIFDDFLRDQRNQYLSTVFLHWINQPPKPSEEHKVVMVITLEDIYVEIQRGGLILDLKSKQAYGFLHGHDSMIKNILGLQTTQAFIGEIMTTF